LDRWFGRRQETRLALAVLSEPTPIDAKCDLALEGHIAGDKIIVVAVDPPAPSRRKDGHDDD
jgi:hypothetical protein